MTSKKTTKNATNVGVNGLQCGFDDGTGLTSVGDAVWTQSATVAASANIGIMDSGGVLVGVRYIPLAAETSAGTISIKIGDTSTNNKFGELNFGANLLTQQTSVLTTASNAKNWVIAVGSATTITAHLTYVGSAGTEANGVLRFSYAVEGN